MPGPNYVMDKGFQATSVITQFYAVKQGASDQTATIVTGTTDLVLGIAQEAATAANVTAGRIINVRLLGISRCVASAAITRGARVVVTATGKMAAASAAVGAQNIVGVAMMSAGADGDHFDVLLTPGAGINTAVS
jgi:hypothetical protein